MQNLIDMLRVEIVPSQQTQRRLSNGIRHRRFPVCSEVPEIDVLEHFVQKRPRIRATGERAHLHHEIRLDLLFFDDTPGEP